MSMRCRTEQTEAAGVPMGWGSWQRGAGAEGMQKGHPPSPAGQGGALSPLQGLALCLWLLCPSLSPARTCSSLLLITTRWEPIPVQFCSLSTQDILSVDR